MSSLSPQLSAPETPDQPVFAPILVRSYGEKAGDYQAIAGWWEARYGKQHPFFETFLPPLGIVAEQNGERMAALWAYESYGIGVAFPAFACTKPGILPQIATLALMRAEKAVETILRARGNHNVMVGLTTPRMGRHLDKFHYTKVFEGEACMHIWRIDNKA